jgi:uncharacterized membrane protein YgcG
VTKEDLLRVAKEMLKSEPSVGCVGHDLSHVPQYEDINAFVKMYVKESVNAAQSGGGSGSSSSGGGGGRRR